MAGMALVLGTLLAHGTSTDSTLHELMEEVVAVQTKLIWDIGNASLDDEGNPDPAKITPLDWGRVAAASVRIRQVADALAVATPVKVAAPGHTISGEGTPGAFGAKEVQAAIDADRAGFRQLARKLALAMRDVNAVAKSRDASRLFEVSGRIDEVCEQCHKRYWYPADADKNK